MIQKSIRGLAAIALMLGALPAAAEKKIIKIDGSSTVYPITEAVTKKFIKTHSSYQLCTNPSVSNV
jgi:ABC-type phosphate transport system substrate-binding protein